jgi:hypothetical protein
MKSFNQKRESKKPKSNLDSKSPKASAAMVHDTAGGEMPDPSNARYNNGRSRSDASAAFAKPGKN